MATRVEEIADNAFVLCDGGDEGCFECCVSPAWVIAFEEVPALLEDLRLESEDDFVVEAAFLQDSRCCDFNVIEFRVGDLQQSSLCLEFVDRRYEQRLV